MPIHFSIGFVVESQPRRAIVAACAGYVGEVQANAGYVSVAQARAQLDSVINLRAVWPREDNCR